MSYNYYFYMVEKDLIKQIQLCTNEEELYNLFIENDKKATKDSNGHIHCPPFEIGKEVFDFGEYYKNAVDGIQKLGSPLFKNQELYDVYEDYNPYVCDKDAILWAIKWQKNKIVEYYSNLIKEEQDDNTLDGRSHYDKLLQHCKSQLLWWNHSAINLDLEKTQLTDSWLYEYTIFNLVNLYKTFDNEKYYLLFIGY